ncbi:MAG TPA: nitroreductase family protein [Candidatus Dormibacteraeota bacterium]|jgi:nitroreductase|nr:nitroreductase family protein [Candidatus Dormibacteraeota bacterium]
MEFEKVVRKRRMIRAFRQSPVPDDKIGRIVELAQHYPSAGFSQGVAFVIITEPEKVQRLRELNRLRGDAPVLIVPCVSEKLYHDRYHEADKLRPDGTEIDWPIPYWYFDAGCASLLVLLGAVNEGLSAYIAGAFRPDLLRVELGIPDFFVPVGVISIGNPDYEKHRPSPSLDRGRRPSSQVVHYEQW